MTQTPTYVEPLTPREEDVARLMARGLTNPEIAEELGLTFGTAKWYVSQVIAKTGASSREEAVATWKSEHAPMRRFRRALAGAFAGGTLTKAGIGAAVVAGGAAGVVAVVAVLGAFSGGDEQPAAVGPSPTVTDVTPTVEPSPTAPPEPTPPDEGALPEAPAPGPCPVQHEICDAAIDVYQRVADGDVDALMANASGQPLECFGPDAQGFPYHHDLCGDAPAGTFMDGFLGSSGGEGIYLDAPTFREWLSAAVEHAATADPAAEDDYSTGELRIAAIGCFARSGVPEGECGRDWIELVLTHISESEPPPPLGGLPGRYVTCLELYWPENAPRPGLSGIGCGVPPEGQLGPLDLEAANAQGVEGTFRNHPWTPPGELLATYPWSTRTGVEVVDEVIEALETGGEVPIQGTQIECVEEQVGIGAPPLCPEGVPEGTPIEAFFSSSCEGAWTPITDLDQDRFFRSTDIPWPRRIYAIGRPDPSPRPVDEGGGPTQDYLMIIAFPLGDGENWEVAPYTLGLGASGVLSTHYPCGDTLEGYASDGTLQQNGWVLPPGE